MPPAESFAADIAWPLGGFFLLGAAANLVVAWRAWRRGARGRAGLWLGVAAVFAYGACRAAAGVPPQLPEAVKHALNALATPAAVTLGSAALLAGCYLARRRLVVPCVAWAALCASLLLLGLSAADPHFAALVLAPDHIAIVGMVYLLGLFTWVAAAQAVENDRRAAEGRPPVEKEDREREKVLVWPDLVYTELICAVLVGVLLLAWSLAVPAPLEGPADPMVTPNPAKAPWYFVGLQELLVYADAWYAGVVVPCLIVLGLMAIPYLDRNPEGSGYYAIRPRRFAYLVFQFGFLQLWILLILVGMFLRGPDWESFGPFEPREPRHAEAAVGVRLSEAFWEGLVGREAPQPARGASGIARFGAVLWREVPGVVVLGLYFLAVPPLLGRTWLAGLRERLGRARYAVAVVLLLFMLTLPLKMLLRWTFGLSYILTMPEYLLNF
jgi:hypothetical protein